MNGQNNREGISPADLAARSAKGFAFNPRTIGRVNWLGAWTLYAKEVERFLKVAMQSVVAPVTPQRTTPARAATHKSGPTPTR